MQLKTNNHSKSNFKKWSDFLSDHTENNFFQSPEFYKMCLEVKNFHPKVIQVYDEKDNLLGSLLAIIISESNGIKGFLSSRTVIYGGPLIDEKNDKHSEILDKLLKGLINRVKNKSLFIQFRNFFSQKKHIDTFNRNGFNLQERLNSIVDTSIEKAWKNISESKRRQIKKSLRSGAEIFIPTTIDEIREFYKLLFELYKYKVKKPLPDWTFFKEFFERIHNTEFGKYLLIRFEGRIIGGILSPVTPTKTIYEWYVCGLDKEYKEKGIYPSILATYAAIDYAIKNNISEFDFMGVGKPNKEYGVRDFKMKFGGKTVNFGRFERINNKFLYSVAEFGYNLLSIYKKI